MQRSPIVRFGVLTTAVTILLVAGMPLAATSGPSPDMDSDGVPDSEDICKMDPMAPLLCGSDTDQDGYGNACDFDLNNDSLVNGLDFVILRLTCYSAGSDPTNAGCDLNCDTLVNGLDTVLFLPHFLAGTPPGPSGLPCAGTVPCLP